MTRSSINNRIIRILCLVIIVVFALLLCGCRSRLTNRTDANATVMDDGVMLDSYEWRRSDLELSETQQSVFSGLNLSGGVEDDEYDEYDEEFDGMMEDYSPEEDEYVDESETETDSAAGTTTTPGNVGRTGTMRRPVRTPTTKTKTVKVTFDANGGALTQNDKDTETISVVYTVDKTYGSLPSPEREGYAFEAWYTAKEGGDKVTSKTKVTEEKEYTLYAHWVEVKTDPEPSPAPEAESYILTFDAKDGQFVSGEKSIIIKTGEAYGANGHFPVVRKPGYKLDSWVTADGKAVTESDIFEGNSNMTLVPKWGDEYDAVDFWNSELDTVAANEEFKCYIELEDGNTTYESTLLSKSKLGNIASKTDTTIPIEEVLARNPGVIIKTVKDMDAEKAEAAKAELEQRITAALEANPALTWEGVILIVPETAETGTDKEKAFYPIDLLSRVFEGVFTPEEAAKAAEELGIKTSIYQ